MVHDLGRHPGTEDENRNQQQDEDGDPFRVAEDSVRRLQFPLRVGPGRHHHERTQLLEETHEYPSDNEGGDGSLPPPLHP